MDAVEVMAADVLLERGVGFKIPAPFLFRLFGRRVLRIKVKRLYLGTLLHLSEMAALGDLERVYAGSGREGKMQELGGEGLSLSLKTIESQLDRVCYCTAACLLNGKWRIRLFASYLARVLRRRCTADQLQEIALWLFVYGRPESFTNTTKFLSKMRTTMRRTGQAEKRG